RADACVITASTPSRPAVAAFNHLVIVSSTGRLNAPSSQRVTPFAAAHRDALQLRRDRPCRRRPQPPLGCEKIRSPCRSMICCLSLISLKKHGNCRTVVALLFSNIVENVREF